MPEQNGFHRREGGNHKMAAKEGQSENVRRVQDKSSPMVGLLDTSCSSDGVNTRLDLLLEEPGNGPLGLISRHHSVLGC